MSTLNLNEAGFSALSESRMQKVQKNIHAIRYRAGIAMIDRRTIAIMRDYLFDLSCDLQIIEKQVDQSPEQAYFMAKLIEHRLMHSGLKSDLFPDVADKEYFVQTRNGVQKILSSTVQKLDQDTQEKVAVAVQYGLDLPLLKRAKQAKEAQEFLDTTESKYQSLVKQSSRRTTLLTLGIIGLIVNLIGLFIILFVVGPVAFVSYFYAVEEAMVTSSANQTITGVIIIVIFGVILSWTLSMLLLILGMRKNPETAKLFQVREVAKKNLISNAAGLEVKQKFGVLSSVGYGKLYQERINNITPLLGSQSSTSLTVNSLFD